MQTLSLLTHRTKAFPCRNLLSFLLSGLPADGTIAAEVAFMFQEWFKPGACLEFPKGGSQAMVAALIRGVKKKGGKVRHPPILSQSHHYAQDGSKTFHDGCTVQKYCR